MGQGCWRASARGSRRSNWKNWPAVRDVGPRLQSRRRIVTCSSRRRLALRHRHADRPRLGVPVPGAPAAGADDEDRAPLGDLVEARPLVGEDERVAEREARQARRAEPHAARPACDGGQQGQRRRAAAWRRGSLPTQTESKSPDASARSASSSSWAGVVRPSMTPRFASVSPKARGGIPERIERGEAASSTRRPAP